MELQNGVLRVPAHQRHAGFLNVLQQLEKPARRQLAPECHADAQISIIMQNC